MDARTSLASELMWTPPGCLERDSGNQFFSASTAIVSLNAGCSSPDPAGRLIHCSCRRPVHRHKTLHPQHREPLARSLSIAASWAMSGLRDRRAAAGTPLHGERQGRFINKANFDKTHDFFDRMAPRRFVLGRFVPIVRTFITVVAGAGKMERRHFFVWERRGRAVGNRRDAGRLFPSDRRPPTGDHRGRDPADRGCLGHPDGAGALNHRREVRRALDLEPLTAPPAPPSFVERPVQPRREAGSARREAGSASGYPTPAGKATVQPRRRSVQLRRQLRSARSARMPRHAHGGNHCVPAPPGDHFVAQASRAWHRRGYRSTRASSDVARARLPSRASARPRASAAIPHEDREQAGIAHRISAASTGGRRGRRPRSAWAPTRP